MRWDASSVGERRVSHVCLPARSWQSSCAITGRSPRSTWGAKASSPVVVARRIGETTCGSIPAGAQVRAMATSG